MLKPMLGEAWHAMGSNPMRTALTVLGIVIGIAAVIIMMEIGQGSKAAISKSIASMGANNLLIMPGTAAIAAPNRLALAITPNPTRRLSTVGLIAKCTIAATADTF